MPQAVLFMEAIKIYLMFKKMGNIHASSQKFIILGEGPEKSRAIDYIKNQEAKQ